MKKIFLILILLVSCMAISQERFSSKKYNFAITFPKDWDVKTHSDKFVVEAYENDNISISISALYQPRLPDSMDIGYISRDSIKTIIMAQMEKQYTKSLLLRSGNGLMDGVLAYYYFIQYSDNKDGFPDKFVCFQYQFLYKTIFYSIFAVCPTNQYESREKTFNDIYKTFRFIKKL